MVYFLIPSLLPFATITSNSSFVRGMTERRLCLMRAMFFKRLSFFISSKGTGFFRVSTGSRSTTTQRRHLWWGLDRLLLSPLQSLRLLVLRCCDKKAPNPPFSYFLDCF